MVIQTQGRRFAFGQRVKVVVLRHDGAPIDHLPPRFLKFDGKIGYVSSADVAPEEGEGGVDARSSMYEVFIIKVGATLQLPEECLVEAGARRFVL
jgi:hypothetical protein